MKIIHGVVLAGILAGAPTALLAAEATETTEPEMRTVVAGPEYAAGGAKQRWLGKGYRDIWTMPVELPVLDLKTEAGDASLASICFEACL